MDSLAVVGVPGLFGSASSEFNKDTVANLAHWYKPGSTLYQDSGKTTPVASDGDPVGAWEDTIAAGNDIVQATTAAKPTYRASVAALNGQPALQFDGNDFLMGAFSAGALSLPYTIFIVFQITTLGSTNMISDGDDAAHLMTIYKTGTPGWGMYAGTVLEAGTPNTNAHIITAEFNGASSNLFLDGGAPLASGNAGSQTGDGLTLGSRYGGVNFMTGYIAEYLLYSVALSVADKNIVQNYISAKYGVSVTAFS